MDAVYDVTNKKAITSPLKVHYDDAIEQAIGILEPSIKVLLADKLNSRWVTLKLLDGDTTLLKALQKYLNFDLRENIAVSNKLKEANEILSAAGIENDLFRDKVVSHIVPSPKIRFNEHGDLLDPRTGQPVVYGDGVQFKEP